MRVCSELTQTLGKALGVAHDAGHVGRIYGLINDQKEAA